MQPSVDHRDNDYPIGDSIAGGSVSTKFAEKMMSQMQTPNVNFAVGQSSLITPAPACNGDEDQSTILFESMHVDKQAGMKDFKDSLKAELGIRGTSNEPS